ncbi:MAG: glycosyltransferase [Calditrichaceae bacterium]|nr:glycosyltransferase [Calditrichaceae bacterium]MBN2710344.1 glycosyltransferase [Calditrichaceae bacterium]RQV95094.1 MAG: glycosyltransferase family 1 protein [Calditrichota bacterium]
MKLIKLPYKNRINNYFKTKFQKHVLISYITAPFKKGISLRHTNTNEALAMAEVFRELEFNVDVISYDDINDINYEKYDIIIGFGEPLVNYFYQNNKRLITIYYSTGMHTCWQNTATLKRVEEVFLKKGIWILKSTRLVEKAWSIQSTLVDYIITLGNSTTIESYRKFFDRPIFNIPVTYYNFFNQQDILEGKDYKSAKRNFLWFGGDGLIHKGLDLLLEIFSESNDNVLHVCGRIDKEAEFKNAYYKELYQTSSIHTYGFVSIDSEIFQELLKKCGFIIFPSCSEGEPSSVINTMYYGLIPIVPSTAGINVQDFGIQIKELTHSSINQAICEADSLTIDELSKRSLKTANYTSKQNSIDNYKLNLKSVLQRIISDNKNTYLNK